jgi:hypothetical protein
MVSKIHVKHGLEFKKNLYQSDNRKPWLEAVGAEIEKKGVALKMGEGTNAVEIRNSAELVAFFEKYTSAPAAMAAAEGLPEGRELKDYVSDMMQALDDVVKWGSAVQAGDVIDFSTQGEIAKTLGMDTASLRYGSSNTGFGQNTAPDGTLSVLGVQFANHAARADPLEGVPFIDATTFATHAGRTGRESQEFESVKRLNGLDGDQILALMRGERAGRPILNRARKASDHEAFSLGFSGIGIDEMRWDSRAHRTREMNPLISLTVESGRMEWDEDDKEYEVSQGTDYFHDRYYTAKDPNRPGVDLLGETGNMVRSRIRYDEPGNARRLLIQSKSGTEVDENGMKQAAKADIRDDSPTPEKIASIDEDARSGTSSWGWNNTKEPIAALNNVYKDLKEKDVLPDVGPHEDVLLMEVGAHVFSTRSRYHLNETNTRDVKRLFDFGDTALADVGTLIEKNEELPAADLDALKALHTGITDKSILVDRVKDKLAELDPNLSAADINVDVVTALMPNTDRPTDALDVKKRRVVADATREVYGELAEAIDDARSGLSGARTPQARDFDFEVETQEFMKTKYPELEKKTTYAPFMTKLDEVLAGADKDAFIQELGQWLNDEKGDDRLVSAPDKDLAMGGLRKNMVREHIEILHRQLEGAGTAGQALWFDGARSTYAKANRQTWNFLIDTFDFVTDIRPADWETLTPEQQDGREPIPADKIYNADVIAEVQIELGYEKPYLEALSRSKKALDGARAGLFMDYALDQGIGGTVADQPATFAALQKDIVAATDSNLLSQLEGLNQFAASKGSPLQFTRENLTELSEDLFTTDRQGQSTDGHAGLNETQEMNTFIWDTILSAQESIVDLRGGRVIREAERAGHSGVSWDDSPKSKGATALTHPDL